jgi:hypothetical protein
MRATHTVRQLLFHFAAAVSGTHKRTQTAQGGLLKRIVNHNRSGTCARSLRNDRDGSKSFTLFSTRLPANSAPAMSRYWGQSKMLAGNAGVSAEQAAKEWTANVIPGITIIPSGTWGVNRAQEGGCTYCADG